MSQHLDDGRISRCVLGDAVAEDLAHLACCAQCRGEVERFEGALGAFRTSAREWGAQDMAAPRVDSTAGEVETVPSPRFLSPVWGMTVIVVLSLWGVGMSLQSRPPATVADAYVPSGYVPSVYVPAVHNDADAELMEQVRADLARPIPRGMEPFRAAFSTGGRDAAEALP
jgi:hypothetical protein